jgi:hypothetical protein
MTESPTARSAIAPSTDSVITVSAEASTDSVVVDSDGTPDSTVNVEPSIAVTSPSAPRPEAPAGPNPGALSADDSSVVVSASSLPPRLISTTPTTTTSAASAPAAIHVRVDGFLGDVGSGISGGGSPAGRSGVVELMCRSPPCSSRAAGDRALGGCGGSMRRAAERDE